MAGKRGEAFETRCGVCGEGLEYRLASGVRVRRLCRCGRAGQARLQRGPGDAVRGARPEAAGNGEVLRIGEAELERLDRAGCARAKRARLLVLEGLDLCRWRTPLDRLYEIISWRAARGRPIRLQGMRWPEGRAGQADVRLRRIQDCLGKARTGERYDGEGFSGERPTD